MKRPHPRGTSGWRLTLPATGAAATLLTLAACTNPTPATHAPAVGIVHGATVTKVAPDAQAVLDAWAEAIGGRDALEAFGAVHAKGTYEEGGMRGTIELWITPRGERREDIMLGPLHEVRVFDGTQGWLVDRNHAVRELAGVELDDQLALAFRESFAPLLVDRRPGAVSRDGNQLVFSPEGGRRPETVAFDPAKHVPETITRRDGEKLRTIKLSDYNGVGALKFPFTVHEETGNPNETITIHYKTIERGNTTVGMFTRPADSAVDFNLASDPVTVPIEIVYGGLIFVKVTVNDKPMSFILDTGAEFTLLNSSRVSKLGLQGVGTFATGAGGGDVVVSFVPHVTIDVGGARTVDQIVGAVLIDALETPLQRPLDGILGYDFLSRFVVEIDYAAKTLKLYDRTKYTHTAASAAIPITLEDSTPYFDAAIEVPQQGKISGHFVLDTGCLCEVQLFTPFVDSHKLLTAFPKAKQAGYSAGAGGTTNQLSAVIPSLEIGTWVIPEPHAEFSRDSHGATADPETAGLIGSGVFSKFKLVLDYQRKQAFFDPPAPSPAPAPSPTKPP